MNNDGSNFRNLSGPLVAGGDIDEFQFTPDSQYIVYRADQETLDHHELYSVHLGTSVNNKLNQTLVDAYGIQSTPYYKLSPDSTKVIYLGIAASKQELFIVNIDGTGNLRLNGPLVGAGQINSYSMIFSPDSSKVAYSSREKDLNYDEIYVVNIDSTGQTKLSPNPGTGKRGDLVSFLPDNSGVIFTGEWDTTAYTDVYYANVDGSGLVRLNTALSHTPAFYQDAEAPFVSLSNSRIVYRSDQITNNQFDLYSVNKDGTGRVMLKENNRYEPIFLSDAQTIIYLADPDLDGNFSIFSINIDGTQDQMLVDIAGKSISSCYVDESTSKIIYAYGDSSVTKPSIIGQANLDGSNQTILFQSQVYIKGLYPNFGHHSLTFKQSNDLGSGSYDNETLLAIDMITKEIKNYPRSLAVGEAYYDMAPDGSNTLIFAADKDFTQQAELYKMNLDTHSVSKINPPLSAFTSVIDTKSTSDPNRLLVTLRMSNYFEYPAFVNLDGSTWTSPINESFLGIDWQYQINLDASQIFFPEYNSLSFLQLMSINADGTGLTQLNPIAMKDDMEVHKMSLAPNGSRLAYIAEQNANNLFELFAVNVDGSNFTQLNQPLPPGGKISLVKTASDNLSAVFIGSQDTAGVNEIYSIKLDGSLFTKLNPPLPLNGNVLSFAIDPTSQYVVLTADAEVDGESSLFSVKLDGSQFTKLSGSLVAGGNVSPAYSHSPTDPKSGFSISGDGNQILFMADKEVDEVTELYAVDIDGSNLRKISGSLLLSEDVTSKEFSPDGERVAFTTKISNLAGGRLFSVKVDGSDLKMLHKNLASGEFIADYKISGQYIVFRWYRNGHYQIYKSRLDGSGLTQLHGDLTGLQHVSTNYRISWDQNWVLFDINIDDLARPSIFRVPL